jgi:hypothetical protein
MTQLWTRYARKPRLAPHNEGDASGENANQANSQVA